MNADPSTDLLWRLYASHPRLVKSAEPLPIEVVNLSRRAG
jgi:hypothetical protein